MSEKAEMISNGVLDPDPLKILPDDRIHHVYPTFGRDHSTDARGQCWCQPEVQFMTERRGEVDGHHEYEIVGAVIVHHQEN